MSDLPLKLRRPMKPCAQRQNERRRAAVANRWPQPVGCDGGPRDALWNHASDEKSLQIEFIGYAANSARPPSWMPNGERPTARRIAETGVFENDSIHSATLVVGACSTIEATAAALRGA